jgi:predicted RNase H-like nuclease (RuvC/YqgF family)
MTQRKLNTEPLSGQKTNPDNHLTIANKEYEIDLYKKAIKDIDEKISRLEDDKTFLNRVIGRLENEIKSLKS